MNASSQIARGESLLDDDRLGDLHAVQVLLVEDDAHSREALAQALEECGARVTAVASVQAALASFEPTASTVLISDIEMPEQDGYALIRQVRALDERCSRRTPAIAVTGLPGCEAIRAAGFDEHVSKPVDLGFLVERIRALVGF